MRSTAFAALTGQSAIKRLSVETSAGVSPPSKRIEIVKHRIVRRICAVEREAGIVHRRRALVEGHRFRSDRRAGTLQLGEELALSFERLRGCERPGLEITIEAADLLVILVHQDGLPQEQVSVESEGAGCGRFRAESIFRKFAGRQKPDQRGRRFGHLRRRLPRLVLRMEIFMGHDDQQALGRCLGERDRDRLLAACDSLHGVKKHIVLAAAGGAALFVLAHHAQRAVERRELAACP